MPQTPHPTIANPFPGNPPPTLTTGQLVFVRVRIGTQNFGDTFDVIRTTRTAQGTTNVHLRVQVAEPVQA